MQIAQILLWLIRKLPQPQQVYIHDVLGANLYPQRTHTYGTGPGRDFHSLAAWETATDRNLADSQQSQTLELHDDEGEGEGEPVSFPASWYDADGNRLPSRELPEFKIIKPDEE